MTPRERVLNLIAGKPVDRPPAMPVTMMWAADLIGAKYHDYAMRAEIQAAGQCAAASQFGFDHVSVISDPCCEAADLGAAIFHPPDGPPAIIEENALLADPGTLRTLRVPDPHRTSSRMANRVAAVRLLRRQLGDTHLIEGWVEGPCAESADLRGINTIMMDYYDAPDFIHDLAEFTVSVALNFASAQIEAGADIIGVGDAAASLISRELYDKFVLRMRSGSWTAFTPRAAGCGCTSAGARCTWPTPLSRLAARLWIWTPWWILARPAPPWVIAKCFWATCIRSTWSETARRRTCAGGWPNAAPRPGRLGSPGRAAKCLDIRRRKMCAASHKCPGRISGHGGNWNLVDMSIISDSNKPEPNPPGIALLACSVFEREIALYGQGARHIAELRFFEIGLHDQPDHLRAILQENFDAVDARNDIEAVVLAYGLCGRGTAGLRPLRHKLVIPRAHDCVTLFMGSKEAYAEHHRRCPTCYYYTPGWNRARRVPGPEMLEALRAKLAARFDPEEIEFLIETEREQWALRDTATYVDLGTDDAPAEADYAGKCAEWLGWKFERLQGDATLLKDLLWGRWDNERFQIIKHGMQLGHALDESILRAEPLKIKL
jgi:hypothetical protein